MAGAGRAVTACAAGSACPGGTTCRSSGTWRRLRFVTGWDLPADDNAHVHAGAGPRKKTGRRKRRNVYRKLFKEDAVGETRSSDRWNQYTFESVMAKRTSNPTILKKNNILRSITPQPVPQFERLGVRITPLEGARATIEIRVEKAPRQREYSAFGDRGTFLLRVDTPRGASGDEGPYRVPSAVRSLVWGRHAPEKRSADAANRALHHLVGTLDGEARGPSGCGAAVPTPLRDHSQVGLDATRDDGARHALHQAGQSITLAPVRVRMRGDGGGRPEPGWVAVAVRRCARHTGTFHRLRAPTVRVSLLHQGQRDRVVP